MADERRTSPRVRVTGVRVVYESGGGEPVEADALDLGTGGLFVRTATPLAVGKRITLEIQVVGEAAPWAALGRVVWSREKGDGESAPPGMGVKLIDADDAVLASLARLVETHERAEPGVGRRSTPPPVPATAPPPRVSAPLPPRGGGSPEKGSGTSRVLVILVLLVVAGIAAYVLLDALRQHRHSVRESAAPSAWAVV